MKKFSPNTIAISVIVAIVLVGGIILAMPRHLSGTYTAKINLLMFTSTDRMTFEGNKVIENKGTRAENKGTYQIKGDQMFYLFLLLSLHTEMDMYGRGQTVEKVDFV